MNVNKSIILSLIITFLLVFGVFNTTEMYAETINVMSHRVHEEVAIGDAGAGIDLMPDFEEQTGMTVNWETQPWSGMKSIVLREATLSDSDYNVMFILNDWFTDDFLNLFIPLNDYMEEDPLKDFDVMASGMIDNITRNGNIYGIPYRGNSALFYYNEEILENNGFEDAPETFEEVIEMAKEVSGHRDDGARVYGIRLQVDEFVNWARAWDGDAVTKDYEITMTEEPMLKALRAANELYEAGAVPPNFMNMTADDYLTYFLNGQLAMTIRGSGYYGTINDPDESDVADNFGFGPFPASEEVDIEVAPTEVNFWAMAIPKNSTNKNIGWEFLKYFSTRDAALSMALNGNGPTILDVYEDKEYIEKVPYAQEARKTLDKGRPLWPSFERVSEAREIFQEEVTRAIVGEKSPEEAMNDAAEAIEPMLPDK